MRVLVVEDERRLAETLQWGLEADGYAVDLAHDGVEGLELAQLYPYQVIVLDIMLPKLNGYRVCATLRKGGVSTPILMLTAKNGRVRRGRGARHGSRRLPEQAVLLRGAHRTAARPHPPGRGRCGRGAGVR